MAIGDITLSDYTPRDFQEARKHFATKVPMTSQAFDLLSYQQRAKGFRIANVNSARIILQVRGLIARALRGDITMRQLQKEMRALLAPGEFSRYINQRLSIVFQQNMATAWAVGRRRAIDSPFNRTFLWIMYASTRDTHVRPSHRALDGLVFPKDDSFWDSYEPPWEWGCRCTAIPLSERQLARLKATVQNRQYVESRLSYQDEQGRTQAIRPNPQFDFRRDQGDPLESVMASLTPDFLRVINERAPSPG